MYGEFIPKVVCMKRYGDNPYLIDLNFLRLLYDTLFGGVVMFKKEDFLKVNGFSNVFWGWGGEDDNLYQRLP